VTVPVLLGLVIGLHLQSHDSCRLLTLHDWEHVVASCFIALMVRIVVRAVQSILSVFCSGRM